MKPQERTMAILRSGRTPAERLVLVALATFLGDDQEWCWPVAETLADLTGFDERHVRKLLERLRTEGVVERQGQRRRRIVWERLAAGAQEDETGPRDRIQPEVKPGPGPTDPVPGPGKNRAQGPPIRPLTDQLPVQGGERAREPRRSRRGAGAPRTPAPPSPPGPCGLTEEAAEVAGRMLEAITGSAASVRPGTMPKAVAKFLEALAGCAPAGLLSDVALVAEAARECPDPVFADEIRAHGWNGKRDWSRRPGTILDPTRWSERLAAARAWEAAGKPRTNTPVQPAGLNGRPSTGGPGWQGDPEVHRWHWAVDNNAFYPGKRPEEEIAFLVDFAERWGLEPPRVVTLLRQREERLEAAS